jgi:hypothetical protein
MKKTAQQKLNEYYNELNELQSAIDNLSAASYEKYESHSYAVGCLGQLLQRAVSSLPKKEREAFKQNLNNLTARLIKKGD